MRSLRKILIGLITIAVVFGIFIFYNRMFPSRIEPLPKPVAGEKLVAPPLNDKSPRIGNTALGPVALSRFTILDEQKKVKRVFGFEKLLNPDQDSQKWKLTKPYMNIYGSVETKIFSDRGTVQVENIAGKPSPADAHLVDDVQIHISSKDPKKTGTMVIYMDDLYYDSERSEFSTDGPIYAVSDNGQIKGTGMLMVYNNELNRIEDFRIKDLTYLYIRNISSLTSPTETGDSDPDRETVDVWLRCKGGVTIKPLLSLTEAIQAARTSESPPENYYECRFYKDVNIEYGDELIVDAGSELFIENILWANDSDRQGSSDTESSDKTEETVTSQTTTAEHSQIAKAPIALPVKPQVPADTTSQTQPSPLKNKPAHFYAKNIVYDMITENAIAQGPVKFVHYDKHNSPDQPAPFPMTVTASKDAEFFKKQNRIVFNKDIEGISYTQMPVYLRKDTFVGQKLIIDIATSEQKGITQSDIRHITLLGPDGVQLDSQRTASDETITHIRLYCVRVDHDTIENIIIAKGPGKIELDNSKLPHPPKDSNQQGPCYAYMDGFDDLLWLTVDNQITAKGTDGAVHVGYLPITEDAQLGQLVTTDATRVQANFVDIESGRSLKQIRATGGIHYKETGGNEFLGDSLFYDAAKSIMTVRGSSAIPCILNGAPVERIEYDPKTKNFQGTLSTTPGAILRPKK